MLRYIAGLNIPLVEIGSGKGYWAYLLRLMGTDIIASDIQDARTNPWTDGGSAFVADMIVGLQVEDIVSAYAYRALMMQWISPGAAEGAYAVGALRSFRGQRLLIVGEERNGSMADGQLFDLLDRDWQCVKRLPLPRFVGVMDSLYHLERRARDPVYRMCSHSLTLSYVVDSQWKTGP